ncbi:hypothetical protein AS189_17310 [Arthrobacter alpinus]|uniref:Uncharacterized protein n=1 Tax=Arthrobacter alpinus TaxID=656366 RepID=A0A0S2M2P8_9MICC|nr:hypothetical protein [Arthrobacter alpinus]ALO67918.1 hypothetical protein AS189_17310 [Arthrobacter alpinus]
MTENPSLTPAHGDRVQQERSQLAGTVVALVGWAVVVVPIILMSVLIFAAVMEPSQSLAAPARVALIFAGAVLLFCMIAAPHLLGQAVRFKEKAMWRAALITGIPTVCVVLYFVFRWLSNLG